MEPYHISTARLVHRDYFLVATSYNSSDACYCNFLLLVVKSI